MMNATEKSALETWREKLEYLRREEATCADPVQRFHLEQEIERAKTKIVEIESERDIADAPTPYASSPLAADPKAVARELSRRADENRWTSQKIVDRVQSRAFRDRMVEDLRRKIEKAKGK